MQTSNSIIYLTDNTRQISQLPRDIVNFSLSRQMNSLCWMKIQRGFTLIELLIGISIISILLAVGLPSFIYDFDKNKLITASEQLYSHLQQARIESISRSNSITLTFSGSGSSNWLYGYNQGTAACDLSKTSPTDNNACIVIINDGDAVVDGVNGGVDDGDKVLKRFTNSQFSDVSMALSGFSNGSQITFNPMRGISDSGQINLTSAQGLKLRVNVTALGMIKICDPIGTSSFYSVSSC